MKPIKLKIKGLNSFIDAQEIDFERLTEKGLFGIFGPTGSGKSTILDGITLALYGEVARKSSNFINTNCDSMNVSFEFQISEKETKRYRVDREFRRDKNTGSARTKSAKIIHIAGENEVVLEDMVRNVTKRCEEIIGLGLDDFTRTVVLPQGKFSEFLRLEGKERRDMLERLFNLQRYGDELAQRLGSKVKSDKERAIDLEGQLKSYEDVSDEIVSEVSRELSQAKEQYAKCGKEFKQAEEKHEEGSQVWSLQTELQSHTEREKGLKERAGEISEAKARAALGEGALRVREYIDRYENALRERDGADRKLQELKVSLEETKGRKEKADARFESARTARDRNLQNLKLDEHKAEEAIREKEALDLLIEAQNRLDHQISEAEAGIRNTELEMNSCIEKAGRLEEAINGKLSQIEGLKVPAEYKNRLNKAVDTFNEYRGSNARKQKLEGDIKALQEAMEEAVKRSGELSKALEDKLSLIESVGRELEKLNESSPGDQNTLLELQERIAEAKVKWDRHRELTAGMDKSVSSLREFQEKLNSLEQEKATLKEDVDRLDGALKAAEAQSMAHILRMALAPGEECPVCGSRQHRKLDTEGGTLENLDSLKKCLEAEKGKYERLASEAAGIQANIKTEETSIGDRQIQIKELGEDFKSVSVDELQNEFVKLKGEIEKHASERLSLEEKLKLLNREEGELKISHGKVLAEIESSAAHREKAEEDLKAETENFERLAGELEAFKAELSVEDFAGKRDEILQREKAQSDLEAETDSLRKELKSCGGDKEALGGKLNALREEIKGKKTTFELNNKTKAEKEKGIREKVGDVEDIQAHKAKISAEIKAIEGEYDKAEKEKDAVQREHEKWSGDIISTQSRLGSLSEALLSDKESLEKALAKESFEDISLAKESIMEESQIAELKAKIEEYTQSLTKLEGAIENLKKRLSGRSLTEEEWLAIQRAKEDKAIELKAVEEKKIQLEARLKDMGERLEEKKKLLKSKEELDYKLGLLSDLEKLFKGKKFVEFVAANQLKYVSIEASKKLREITGGNYGLEADEDGRFIIRDFKNGGAQRDASTLSGGETFLTSLSLALALSSQIQLKGTAPLELFFLDEGFGTLDDNLLEVVMDSLEKIHSERLSIGIISHLEVIKNRVPVQLIVKPAEAGMDGSKVKIERS